MRLDRCDEQIDITIDSDVVITRNLFQEFIVTHELRIGIDDNKTAKTIPAILNQMKMKLRANIGADIRLSLCCN
jgi:hypothetical protein